MEISARARRQWLWAVVMLIVAGVVGLVSDLSTGRKISETDARIEFHKTRLGGQATYPHYAGLGLAYLQKARETGDTRYFGEAEHSLSESLRYQRNYQALRGLTDLVLARHQFPEALRYAEEAAHAMPSDLEAQGALFDALLALGRQQQAAEQLDRMLRPLPGFASFGRLANLRMAQGNAEGALNAIGRACAEAEKLNLPAVTQAWCQVRIGSIYLAGCEPDQAEHAYQRALLLYPGYYLAREHLAERRAARGRTAEAIRLYEDLLATNPAAHYRLALAGLYDLQGQKDRGAALRRQALGELRASAGSTSRADWRPLALLLLADDATRAEGLHWAERDWGNRQDAFAADTLAWAYYHNGRLKNAGKMAAQALAPGQRETVFLLHAAEIRLALQRNGEARKLLDSVLACPATLQPAEKAATDRLVSLLQSPQPSKR